MGSWYCPRVLSHSPGPQTGVTRGDPHSLHCLLTLELLMFASQRRAVRQSSEMLITPLLTQRLFTAHLWFCWGLVLKDGEDIFFFGCQFSLSPKSVSSGWSEESPVPSPCPVSVNCLQDFPLSPTFPVQLFFNLNSLIGMTRFATIAKVNTSNVRP